MKLLIIQLCLLATVWSQTGVGRLQEVFAWKQMTYDIGGTMVLEDRFSGDDLTGTRNKRASQYDDNIYFDDQRPIWQADPIDQTEAPAVNPNDEVGRFYVKYNNIPMGTEKVGNRLFITIPRRRHGIPATLNYIDLSTRARSPSLSPYPDMRSSRSLISVYRTRADSCGRLWMVDTGALEIPNNVMYLQPPSIVVYDLNTDRQILRYSLKSTDLPATNTPTGLPSITIDLHNGDCADAYAYIPDLVTYGVIVYSLRQNDSWRHSHNYYSFMPTAGNLRIAGQSFQWNDGVFSLALGEARADGCRPVFFHPMVSSQEFSVSSCELQSRQTNSSAYSLVGDRGPTSQSTMHELHPATSVMFFAEVGRNALSCWNVNTPLNPQSVEVLASDEDKISYPADLHVTGDEVWIIANKLPRFIYSRLNPNEYNFFVYKANVQELISGTRCAGEQTSPGSSHSYYPRNFRRS
ncbi:L-dopachrome tautomerase yellow-f2-like [Anticarsia gemmatalis]|uniref:L-dopachrome tautomerase yellow-f2-like n=1 Tax=Anticarsia gemmatalis TaxID=129554 RepID=UPI003F76409C